MRPKNFFEKTHSRLIEVREQILRPHLGSVAGPDEWQVAVEAYCVLSHAALVELVEAVADFAAGEIGSALLSASSLPRFTPVYFAHYMRSDEIIVECGAQPSEFDLLRKLNEKFKERHSNIVHKNHGISIEQLRQLLVPVGLFLDPTTDESNALSSLIEQRHTVAHLGMDRRRERARAATKRESPEDTVSLVEGPCLGYFERVVDKAEKQLPAN